MADIAILVAEEYERRVGQTPSASMEFDWKKIIPMKMTVGIDEMKIENLMKKFEAKSPFALAISQSFFSA